MKRTFLFATVLILILASAAWAAQPLISFRTPQAPPEITAGQRLIPAGLEATTWTTLNSITPAASRLAAVAVNGKIYRIAGNASSPTSCGTVQEFDPATGNWTDKTQLQVPCFNVCAAVWRNQIYVPGGSNGSNLNNLQIYYPDGDSVAQGTPLPVALSAAAAAVVADTMYVFGGVTGAALNTVYAYDLVGKTWSSKAAMPTARYFTAATTVGNMIYVIGGYNSSDFSVCERYAPAADTAGGTPWATMTPMSTARGGPGLAEIGGKIYVFGGGWSTYLNTVEQYNPAADTAGGTPWTSDNSFTTGRRTIGAASLGNDAYVVGGYSGAFSSVVERGHTDAPVVENITMQRISVLPYVGNYGMVVHPSLGVGNSTPYGLYNVPLTLRIDSAGVAVYDRTVFHNLNAISGYGIIMPDWHPCKTPGIVYAVTAYAAHTGDQDHTDDTVKMTVTVKDAVWYQYDPAGSTSTVSQNFEPAMDNDDCWIADDFWVEGVDTVRIDSIAVRGFYSVTPHTPDSLSFIITSDSSYYPAFSQTVASAMVLPADFTDTDGDFMARLTTPIRLPAAEKYWLSCQLFMNYTPSGMWYWTSVSGMMNYATTTARWMNPGNGFGSGYTSWTSTYTMSGVSNFCYALYGGTNTGVAGGPVTSRPKPDFSLAQVSPNPVRGEARFSFMLAKAGRATLDVYSLTGQKVASILDGSRESGRHTVGWNGRDMSGHKVASGLYFYRLIADGRSLTRKFVVVR